MKEIKIGTWYTRCCHLDLEQIKNKKELKSMMDDLIPDENGDLEPWVITDFWSTKLEALKEIRKGFSDKDSLIEIDNLIKKTKIVKLMKVKAK